MKILKDIPMKQMKDFWEKTYLSLEWKTALSPDTISSMYKEIGKDLKTQYEYFNFFMKNEDFYAFDLSSIFSYSTNITLAEKGYNAKDLQLNQINFLMLYSINRALPVMLKPLPGSVKDITSLQYELENFDLKRVIIVLDAGFASYKLPEDLLSGKNKIKYILPLRRNFTIIDYELPLNNFFYYNNRGIRWGSKSTPYGTLYLFEDVKLRSEEETTFIEKIERRKKSKNTFELERKKFGKIAILSNVKENGKKIYYMFKERESIEVAFDTLKNLLEIDKTYLQSTEAVNGYFFAIFNALFLYYKILGLLKKNDLSKKFSVSDVLLLLSKVYLVDFGHKKRVTEIPKKVEELMVKMELSSEVLFPKNLRS